MQRNGSRLLRIVHEMSDDSSGSFPFRIGHMRRFQSLAVQHRFQLVPDPILSCHVQKQVVPVSPSGATLSWADIN